MSGFVTDSALSHLTRLSKYALRSIKFRSIECLGRVVSVRFAASSSVKISCVRYGVSWSVLTAKQRDFSTGTKNTPLSYSINLNSAKYITTVFLTYRDRIRNKWHDNSSNSHCNVLLYVYYKLIYVRVFCCIKWHRQSLKWYILHSHKHYTWQLTLKQS